MVKMCGCLIIITATRSMNRKDIIRVLDQPTCCNRIVPWKYFNKTALNMYSLGPYDGREAVILFNEKTRLTEEETIEYFI